jgi:hypothetical protein
MVGRFGGDQGKRLSWSDRQRHRRIHSLVVLCWLGVVAGPCPRCTRLGSNWNRAGVRYRCDRIGFGDFDRDRCWHTDRTGWDRHRSGH